MADGKSVANQPKSDPMPNTVGPQCQCGQPAQADGTLCQSCRNNGRERAAIDALVSGAHARSNGMEGANH